MRFSVPRWSVLASALLLGRDMTVLYKGPDQPSMDLVDDALDEPWPEVDLPTSSCE